MRMYQYQAVKRTAAERPLRWVYAALVACAAAIFAWSVQPAHAADRVNVVMSSFGFLYLPVLTAEQLGYFDQEGIDAAITATQGGSKALAAVTGGDADIYVGATSSALRAPGSSPGTRTSPACSRPARACSTRCCARAPARVRR